MNASTAFPRERPNPICSTASSPCFSATRKHGGWRNCPSVPFRRRGRRGRRGRRAPASDSYQQLYRRLRRRTLQGMWALRRSLPGRRRPSHRPHGHRTGHPATPHRRQPGPLQPPRPSRPSRLPPQTPPGQTPVGRRTGAVEVSGSTVPRMGWMRKEIEGMRERHPGDLSPCAAGVPCYIVKKTWTNPIIHEHFIH